jgi:hypothetical protein
MDKFTFTLRINITYNTTQAIQGYFCSSQWVKRKYAAWVWAHLTGTSTHLQ